MNQGNSYVHRNLEVPLADKVQQVYSVSSWGGQLY